MNDYDAEVSLLRDEAQGLVLLFSRLYCSRFGWSKEEGDMVVWKRDLHLTIAGKLESLGARNRRLLETIEGKDPNTPKPQQEQPV